MKFKIITTLLLIAMALGLPAQEVYRMSLDECIAYAIENNQDVINSAYEKEIADAQVRETTARGYPQIEVNSALNHNYVIQESLIDFSKLDPTVPPGNETAIAFGRAYDGNAVLSASQLLFEGSFFVGLQAAKTYRELSTKDYIKTQIDVAEAVSKSYYGVLVNEERLKLLEVNKRRLDSIFTDTQVLFSNGFAEKIDVSRIKIQLNNLNVELDNTSRLVKFSRDVLKFQMGAKLSDQIILTDNLETTTVDTYDDTNFDYNQRIEYSQLQTNQALAYLEMKNNKVQYLPSLYAKFNYGMNTQTDQSSELFNGSRWSNFGLIGLSLNVPIFDGFLKSNRIQQNKIQIKQIEQSFVQLENSIDLQVEEARIKLTTALDNMKTQIENKELAEQIYNDTKIKFDEGVGSSIDVVDADADLKTAQTNYYDALYQAFIAKIELEKAYGQLLKN